MIRREIVPDGWPCSLADCPPGPFVTLADPELLCFKSKYRYKSKEFLWVEDNDSRYCVALNSAGEYFDPPEGFEDKACLVQPVRLLEHAVLAPA